MKIKQIIVFGGCMLLMTSLMGLLYNFNETLYSAFFKTIGLITYGSLWAKLSNYLQKRIESEEKKCS